MGFGRLIVPCGQGVSIFDSATWFLACLLAFVFLFISINLSTLFLSTLVYVSVLCSSRRLMSPPGLPGVWDVPVRAKHHVDSASLSVCLESKAQSSLLCPQMVTLQEQHSVVSPMVRKRMKKGKFGVFFCPFLKERNNHIVWPTYSVVNKPHN